MIEDRPKPRRQELPRDPRRAPSNKSEDASTGQGRGGRTRARAGEILPRERVGAPQARESQPGFRAICMGERAALDVRPLLLPLPLLAGGARRGPRDGRARSFPRTRPDARTDSTERVEALAPGPRRRPPPYTGHAELLGRREPLLQQRQVQHGRRDPIGAALRVPTLSRAPRRDPVARRGASGPASSPSRSSSPSYRRSPSASRPTTSSPPSSRRWWPSKPATSRGARKSSRAPSSV